MKYQVFIILFLCSLKGFSQDSFAKRIKQFCEEEIKYESIAIDQESYEYWLAGQYIDSEGESIIIGEIILPSFSVNSQRHELIKVLSSIAKKHSFSGFEVYPSCESYQIRISSTGYSWEKRKENELQIIGKVILE
jgi:hypothetical protein